MSGPHNSLDLVRRTANLAFETAVHLPANAVEVDDLEEAGFIFIHGTFDRPCQLNDLRFGAQLAKVGHALPDLGEARSQQSRIAGSGLVKSEFALEYQKVLLRAPRLEHRNVASQTEIGDSPHYANKSVDGSERTVLRGQRNETDDERQRDYGHESGRQLCPEAETAVPRDGN